MKLSLIVMPLKSPRAGLEIIKLFSCSTQLNMKLILVINVKIPTIDGIVTFIGRINTTSDSFEA